MNGEIGLFATSDGRIYRIGGLPGFSDVNVYVDSLEQSVMVKYSGKGGVGDARGRLGRLGSLAGTEHVDSVVYAHAERLAKNMAKGLEFKFVDYTSAAKRNPGKNGLRKRR